MVWIIYGDFKKETNILIEHFILQVGKIDIYNPTYFTGIVTLKKMRGTEFSQRMRAKVNGKFLFRLLYRFPSPRLYRNKWK